MTFPFHLTIHPLELQGSVWAPDVNVIVAQVDSERPGSGQVSVFVPGMGDLVRELFEGPLEFDGQSLPPWTAEAVDAVVRIRLRQRGMAAKINA